MSKISQASAQFIRNIFGRERAKSDLAISSRELIRTAQGGMYGSGIDVGGIGGIGEALALDRRLLYRYGDYEEMDEYPDINAALDIYADDTTQVDGAKRQSVWVESDDGKIKDELNDLFHERLKIEENIWSIARTLSKYGNDFEEIVVGDGGVVDLNYLPIASVRRVEDKRGNLLGFAQTFSGNVDISPEQFEKLRIPGGGAVGPQKDVAAFEDWRVVHMRLLSKHRESKYGWSVVDAARWIWKRLMLLEDAVMVYKLCLRGDSQVWTTNGKKAIRDLEEGEEVFSYTRDDVLKKTRVVYKKHNGKDRLFRIKSAHRELFANATHPVLVETIIGKGSGKSCGRRMDYVEVKDLRPGEHRLVTPFRDDSLCEDIPLVVPEALDDNKKLNLPKVVNADFAKWFGFMIGVGFASARSFIEGDRACLVYEVGFVSGDKRDINEKYRELFASFFGEPKFVKAERSRHDCVGKFLISSRALYEFMILNGFMAHNRRIPEWVFRSSTVVREAFLEGLADGYCEGGGVSVERGRVSISLESCNFELVRDVRELVMQLGFRVGKITSRERPDSYLPETTIYCVSWSYDRQPMTEELESVEEVEVDDIWDIGVEADEHNFVANGIVVHNTRSPSRYAFYIDVGKSNRQEAERYVQEVMQRLKKKKFVNPKTGKLDLKNNPMGMDEDFFLAMREGREQTRVESLMGPSYQQVDDVEYFLNKLYAAIRIPKAYLGYDQNLPSKATLSMEDVRFGRTILRIQREVRNGLRKIANVDLAARRIDPAATKFDIMMAVPSAIFELGQMEIRRARADLASMMERHVSLYWILSNIYGLAEDEIAEITKQKKTEQKMMGGAGGGMGGGGFESVDPRQGRVISERELMDGKKEDEKRVEEIVHKVVNDPSSPLGRQLRETGHLVREIVHSLHSSA